MPEDYFCRTSTTAPWEPCDHDAYCSAKYAHSDLRRVDYDSPYSLHNWVEQLDIYCTGGFELGILGAVYYLGFLVGNAIFVTPSDVYGRKWFVFAGCMLHSVAYLAMLFSKSLYLNYFLVLMCGTASPMRSNICYVMALEFVPKSKQVFVATFIQVADSVTIVVNALYFWKISTNWKYGAYLGVGVSFATGIAVSFLPEPPRWLFYRGKHA